MSDVHNPVLSIKVKAFNDLMEQFIEAKQRIAVLETKNVELPGINALKAENAILREALASMSVPMSNGHFHDNKDLRKIARAAVAVK